MHIKLKILWKYNSLFFLYKATKQDANKLLLDSKVPYFKKKGEEFVQFDVIDLDPYGSCIPFLDAAIQCANENSKK